MVLESPGEPLRLMEIPKPVPAPGEILLRIHACAVCRTDLHIIDGDLSHPKLPLVLGHQIVGVVETTGARVTPYKQGDRVGVPWLGWTDGTCPYCRVGKENLCDHARFTGYDINGGYAEFTVADARYCFRIPEGYSDAQAAPLLCAGLIGYRAYTMAGDARRLGFYGFGNAAHILTQVARYQRREVCAFTRPGDVITQQAARNLGAIWAGGSDEAPPEKLDAAILFAAAGELVPTALSAVVKGGVVVCAEIHMSDIPSFPYNILWDERMVRSVANLTRRDGEEFLALAPQVPVQTAVQEFPLHEANAAIAATRAGNLHGVAVLVPSTAGTRM